MQYNFPCINKYVNMWAMTVCDYNEEWGGGGNDDYAHARQMMFIVGPSRHVALFV